MDLVNIIFIWFFTLYFKQNKKDTIHDNELDF